MTTDYNKNRRTFTNYKKADWTQFTEVRKITQRNNIGRENTCELSFKLLNEEITSDIGSKRQILQAVDLSQRTQTAVQIVSTLPDPNNGGRIYRVFLACRPCGPAGWLALLLTKAGYVETNPGPTTLNKQVWICDICHKQIHVRKQISIRYNRIEHWVHLRCAGIRQAQYTDTWTCHLHREFRLT